MYRYIMLLMRWISKFFSMFVALQDVLMNLAKAVANAAAMLVLKAKNVAQVAEDTVLQNRVIAAATQCALSTSQLVACAKVQEYALLDVIWNESEELCSFTSRHKHESFFFFFFLNLGDITFLGLHQYWLLRNTTLKYHLLF